MSGFIGFSNMENSGVNNIGINSDMNMSGMNGMENKATIDTKEYKEFC